MAWIAAFAYRMKSLKQCMEDPGHGIPVSGNRAGQISEPRGRRNRLEGIAQRVEGFPDVRLRDPIQRVTVLLIQVKIAVDKGLERAAEAALHPSRPASDASDLAIFQGKESDYPVRLAPLAALEDDPCCFEKRHAGIISNTTEKPWPTPDKLRIP